MTMNEETTAKLAELPDIDQVILFTNGMVMAFDYDGEQVPFLQGHFSSVKEKVDSATDRNTSFSFAQYKSWEQPVTKTIWMQAFRGSGY